MNATTIETNGTPHVPRTRRSRKRLVFQPPRQVPSSVRLLWDTASPEQKTRAHQTCVAILSMWLGRKSRAQVAQELSLPPLRVWQLSQSAVSGMLAGLLKQPRGRGKSLSTMKSQSAGEEDPRLLKKRISELEAENRALKDLLEVLKTFPAVMERPAQPPRKKPDKHRGKRAAVQHRSEAGGGTDAPGSREAAVR
jgi:hypothetical protein